MINNNTYYKPLPNCLTIKQSLIQGLGLFATEFIPKGTNLGITHVKDNRFQDGYIRLPLGGFFNHSETPNCKVVHGEEYIFLVTIEDIEIDTELTAFYTLYNPEN